MDRLDEWLNSLHGWRLALLFWVQVALCFLLVAVGSWGLFGPGPDLALVVVAACSVLAAVPIAVAAAIVRERRRNSRTLPLWRDQAGGLLALLALLLLDLTTQLPGWSHHHRVLAAVAVALILGGAALVLAGIAARNRRLRSR